MWITGGLLAYSRSFGAMEDAKDHPRRFFRRNQTEQKFSIFLQEHAGKHFYGQRAVITFLRQSSNLRRQRIPPGFFIGRSIPQRRSVAAWTPNPESPRLQSGIIRIEGAANRVDVVTHH